MADQLTAYFSGSGLPAMISRARLANIESPFPLASSAFKISRQFSLVASSIKLLQHQLLKHRLQTVIGMQQCNADFA